MKTVQHFVSNGDGWLLALWQTWDPEKLIPGRRPIVIVPGYGMNSFIFSYHPHGASLEGSLAAAGYEVWRADLRGQGEAVRKGGADNFGIADLALTDLRITLAAIVERSRTGANKVDVIGASLGGTFMFMQAVLNPDNIMGTLISMGGPVRWVKVHPAVKVLFSSPTLAGLLPIKGTRRLAELGLPIIAKHVPWLLSIYINPGSTDLSTASELVKTVEDPTRFINREMAEWIANRDIVVNGKNVSEGLRQLKLPLLCIAAIHDGIVPRETAEFPYYHSGSTSKELLAVGDETLAMAHADMFIANEAHARVFAPIIAFVGKQY